ncbi:predicted protein [Streptomyces sp. SPB78]|uniref:hypothetical protein n=1 Tax=Streptomyces sp. (strain SPB78) TaxID=591157 RepID=UPI0001B56983|nr:hypothetical protein [Streptomyces sp. SPB78]EFL01588.1 predicted protein [Streptomyces sp. SPB78]
MAGRVRIRFDQRGLDAVMRLPAVRAALHNEAERIAGQARNLARAEIDDGFADEIRVKDETRPSGRPVAKVEATREDAAAHEWGSSNTERRRVLGRAGAVRPASIFRERGGER